MKLLELPAELPGTASELDALENRVSIAIKVVGDFAAAGPIPRDVVDEWDSLVDLRATLRAKSAELVAKDAEREASERENIPVTAALAPTKPRRRNGEFSERLITALHEAAHSIACVLMGGEVLAAEVFRPAYGEPYVDRDGRQLNGQCRMAPWSTLTQTRKHLIDAAGPAAEAVARYGPTPTPAQMDQVLQSQGSYDFEALQRHALTAGAYVKEPVREVMPLVLRCWPAIVKLAGQMDDGHPVVHADVTAALGLSSDRNLHGFELANIRAGMRTVPQPAAVAVG